MTQLRLNYRIQCAILIVSGIAIGIVSDKLNKNYPHRDYVTLICYSMDIISIGLVIFGIKEIFKKSL